MLNILYGYIYFIFYYIKFAFELLFCKFPEEMYDILFGKLWREFGLLGARIAQMAYQAYVIEYIKSIPTTLIALVIVIPTFIYTACAGVVGVITGTIPHEAKGVECDTGQQWFYDHNQHITLRNTSDIPVQIGKLNFTLYECDTENEPTSRCKEVTKKYNDFDYNQYIIEPHSYRSFYVNINYPSTYQFTGVEKDEVDFYAETISTASKK